MMINIHAKEEREREARQAQREKELLQQQSAQGDKLQQNSVAVDSVSSEEFRRCSPFEGYDSVDKLERRSSRLLFGSTIELSDWECQVALAIIDGDLEKLSNFTLSSLTFVCTANSAHPYAFRNEDIHPSDMRDFGRPHAVAFLELAAAFGRNNVVEYLFTQDKRHAEKCGASAAVWAIKKGWPEVVGTILKHAKIGGYSNSGECHIPNFCISAMEFPNLSLPVRIKLLQQLLPYLAEKEPFSIKEPLSIIGTKFDNMFNNIMRLSFPILPKDKTPAEKAARILVENTTQVEQATKGMLGRLSSMLKNNAERRHAEAVTSFDSMKPDAVIKKVIDSIQAEKEHDEDYLADLEKYLRVFIFDEDAAIVYADADTTAVQQQKERPVGSAAAAGLAITTLGSTASANASVEATSHFDPHAAPVSVTYPSPHSVASAPVASSGVAGEANAASDAVVVATSSDDLINFKEDETQQPAVQGQGAAGKREKEKGDSVDSGSAEQLDALGIQSQRRGDTAAALDLFGLASPPSVVPVTTGVPREADVADGKTEIDGPQAV